MSALEFYDFDRTKDLAKQRELFRSAFPETVGTTIESLDHYNWKFSEFPNSRRSSYEYIVMCENQMAGYYAALPYPYIIHGQERVCGMVCDVMTSPKFQGRGLFTKLGFFATQRMKEAGIDFVSGYPIRPEVIPGHKKVGWSIAFTEPIYICPVSMNSILESKKYLSWLAPFANLILRILNKFIYLTYTKPPDFFSQVLTREDFLKNQEYKIFFDKWSNQQQNYLIKSIDFLRWRTSAPHTIYHFITLKNKNELIAVAIIRVTELKGIKTLAILDLMILNEAVCESGLFFKKIYDFARQTKCDLIAGMISPHWAIKYRLLRYGFLKSPFVFSIIFKVLNEHIKSDIFSGENKWHLMWIDSDDL